MPCSARPSSEGRAGEGFPATPSLPASEARAPVAASRCSSPTGVSRFCEVQTTMAGTVSFCWNAFCASMTCVDSAFWGRKAAWSLVATSPSFPAYGPSPPPTPSQAISSTTGISQRSGRAGVDMGLPGVDISQRLTISIVEIHYGTGRRPNRTGVGARGTVPFMDAPRGAERQRRAGGSSASSSFIAARKRRTVVSSPSLKRALARVVASASGMKKSRAAVRALGS